MSPEQFSDLVHRLIRAESAVVGLRRALRRIVAAEKEFSGDTGIKLDDLISEAVQSAEYVLAYTKWSDEPQPSQMYVDKGQQQAQKASNETQDTIK